MTPTDLTLSWMLWLCIGFWLGYRYHVRRVRKIVQARADRILRDREIDQLLADVAVRCLERPVNVRVN